MKLKLILALAACLMAAPVVTVAQSMSPKEITKMAAKQHKVLKKEGWIVSPGALPLDKQLERSYTMEYDVNDDLMPKYYVDEGRSVGTNYDAAKMQAMAMARQNIAGRVESDITQLIENSVANNQLSTTEATSIAKTLSESKNFISQNLGRTLTVTECYRKLDNGNVEVLVRLAANAGSSIQAGKDAALKELQEDQQDLRERIMKGLE